MIREVWELFFMNRNLRLVFKYIFSFAMVVTFYLHANAKEKAFIPLYDSVLNENPNSLMVSKLIECYPNPATTYINFKFDKSVAHTSRLYIYSFTGKQMNVLSIADNIIKVSLDNYYRGLYMYQLRDANGNILESGKFQVRN